MPNGVHKSIHASLGGGVYKQHFHSVHFQSTFTTTPRRLFVFIQSILSSDSGITLHIDNNPEKCFQRIEGCIYKVQHPKPHHIVNRVVYGFAREPKGF
jgi:hypothetical protein